jgi:hypothetical protein
MSGSALSRVKPAQSPAWLTCSFSSQQIRLRSFPWQKIDFARLQDDLRAAKAYAEEVTKDNPNGYPYSFDVTGLKVPFARTAKVLAAIEGAGLSAFKSKSTSRYRISPPCLQGIRRTEQADAMAKFLRQRGWKAELHQSLGQD